MSLNPLEHGGIDALYGSELIGHPGETKANMHGGERCALFTWSSLPTFLLGWLFATAAGLYASIRLYRIRVGPALSPWRLL